MRGRAVFAGFGIVVLVGFCSLLGTWFGGVASFISLTEGPFQGEPFCYDSAEEDTVRSRTDVAAVAIPLFHITVAAVGLALASRKARSVAQSAELGCAVVVLMPFVAAISSAVMMWAVRSYSIGALLGQDCVQESLPSLLVSALIGMTPALFLIGGGMVLMMTLGLGQPQVGEGRSEQ